MAVVVGVVVSVVVVVVVAGAGVVGNWGWEMQSRTGVA